MKSPSNIAWSFHCENVDKMEITLLQVISTTILLCGVILLISARILVQVNPSEAVILLADATPHTCGAKAAACGRLSSLSEASAKGVVCFFLLSSTFFSIIGLNNKIHASGILCIVSRVFSKKLVALC